MSVRTSLKAWGIGLVFIIIVATIMQLMLGMLIHEAIIGGVFIGIVVTLIAINEARK